jgi:hypothetical protein
MIYFRRTLDGDFCPIRRRGLAALDERTARVAPQRKAQPRRERREAGGPIDKPRGMRIPDLPLPLELALELTAALLEEVWGLGNVEIVHDYRSSQELE